MRLLVAVLSVSLLMVGCSARAASDASPTATVEDGDGTASLGGPLTPAPGTPETPLFAEPPSAVLVRPDGRSYDGALGTFCWHGGCFDMFAYPSNVEPIPLHPGELLKVEYDGDAADSEDVKWYLVVDTPDPDESGVLFWQPPYVTGEEPVAFSFETPSEDGLYLVTVFSRWEGQALGDALYGFYVTVR